MESLPVITTFLGWCTLINLGVYILTAIGILGFKAQIASIHARLTGVPVATLNGLYFTYLANYKLCLLFLNIAPYIALKLMSS